jgi:hypothetical protein
VSHSDYRHPKHDEAAALLRKGMPTRDVAKAVGMARSAALRVRRIEGIEVQRAVPLADKLAVSVVPLDGTSHAVWSGKRNHGTPVIRHRGNEVSAAAVVYEAHYGRPPKGMAKSDCHVDGGGPELCMNPAHILDEDDRQRERRQLRALMGLEAPGGVCAGGHDQTVHGKVEPSLRVYCGTCATERRAANRRLSGR